MPSAIGARDRGGADHAGGARAVLDHDGLLQHAGEMVRDDAAEQIGAAAGRPRHHELDRLRRPGLRGRRPDQCRKDQDGRCN